MFIGVLGLQNLNSSQKLFEKLSLRSSVYIKVASSVIKNVLNNISTIKTKKNTILFSKKLKNKNKTHSKEKR